MDIQEVVPALEQDVLNTLGGYSRAIVAERVRELRALKIEFTDEKLVEDLQQRIHDERFDPVWPACPEHRSHPMEYRGGMWCCPRSGQPVVQLGTLQRLPPLAEAAPQAEPEERRPLSVLNMAAFMATVGITVLLDIGIQRSPLAPWIRSVLTWLSTSISVGSYWWIRDRIIASMNVARAARW
jgi:hypothetical protein